MDGYADHFAAMFLTYPGTSEIWLYETAKRWAIVAHYYTEEPGGGQSGVNQIEIHTARTEAAALKKIRALGWKGAVYSEPLPRNRAAAPIPIHDEHDTVN